LQKYKKLMKRGKKAINHVTIDKNLKIKSFTYVPDSIGETGNKQLYFWKKQHFMPKIDFEITIDI